MVQTWYRFIFQNEQEGAQKKERDAKNRSWKQLGVKVTVAGCTWLVQRHYIALDGIKAWEFRHLAFPEITDAEHGNPN
ncbi:MAG TPA: hypothetical protein VFA33_04870 [Bryobacteraceae bacterium]|nr:hypothetical protein [Bryobacteraceae bacterium]